MSSTIGSVLVLLALFQIKHLLADFFLQTPRMLSGRGDYLHVGRAMHAGVHALGSVIALAIVGASPLFIAVLVGLEWIVHFHIDWAKARYSELQDLQPNQARYWHAFGTDQMLHQLTYVGMVWGWATFGI